MKGRVTVANTYILSKIWYLAEVDPPHRADVKRINRMIFRFIWGHNGEFVNRATMFLPPFRGGLGVINIENRVAAMQGKHVQQTVGDEKAKWKNLAKYWCALSLRELAPALLRKNTPLCDSTPKFYKMVLKNFRENKHLVADWEKLTLRSYLASMLDSQRTKPKVERNYPDGRWQESWKNLLCAKLKNSAISLNFRVVHNVLRTGYRLHKQTNQNAQCPHCGQLETLEHVFVDCTAVNPVGAWLCYRLSSLINRLVPQNSFTLIRSLFPIQKPQTTVHKLIRITMVSQTTTG